MAEILIKRLMGGYNIYFCSTCQIQLAEIHDDEEATAFENCKHFKWKVMPMQHYFKQFPEQISEIILNIFKENKVYLLIQSQK